MFCFMWALFLDCSRSGNFRSITGHFRGRRSTEYSYPGDQPLGDAPDGANSPGNNNSSQQQQHNNSNNVSEKEPDAEDQVSHGTGQQHHHHGDGGVGHDHNMMDLVDSRIEGMEEMMTTVMKQMHRLNRKVRRSAVLHSSLLLLWTLCCLSVIHHLFTYIFIYLFDNLFIICFYFLLNEYIYLVYLCSHVIYLSINQMYFYVSNILIIFVYSFVHLYIILFHHLIN